MPPLRMKPPGLRVKCLGMLWKEHSKHPDQPRPPSSGWGWGGVGSQRQKAAGAAQEWKEGCAEGCADQLTGSTPPGRVAYLTKPQLNLVESSLLTSTCV